MKNLKLNISVIVPTYRRHVLLKRCVEQIHAQISSSDEIIICNDDPYGVVPIELFDCGTDNIRIVDNEGPHGPSGSRNFGALLAKNDVILFIDDDDFLRSGYVDSLKSTLIQHPDADYGGSNIELFTSASDLRKIPALQSEVAHFVGSATESLFGAGCGMWFKRTLFYDLGMFDPELKNSEDNDLCIRAIAHKAKCYKFSRPWVLVNRTAHNEMSNITERMHLNDKIQIWWKVYQKSRYLLPFNNSARIILLERFIRRSVRNGQHLTAFKHIVSELRDPLLPLALVYYSLMRTQVIVKQVKAQF